MFVCDKRKREPPILSTCLLAQASQHLWLVGSHDVYRQFTFVDHTIQILAPNRLDASSRNVSSRIDCHLAPDEGSLSQELRTIRLLRLHVLVGYQWQNIGLHPRVLSSCNSYVSNLMSQPPSEPDVRLVTASGSHGISYVFLMHRGCMPDQRDVIHRILRDGPSGGIRHRQGVVCD